VCTVRQPTGRQHYKITQAKKRETSDFLSENFYLPLLKKLFSFNLRYLKEFIEENQICLFTQNLAILNKIPYFY
jgi:hypothetical protein